MQDENPLFYVAGPAASDVSMNHEGQGTIPLPYFLKIINS